MDDAIGDIGQIACDADSFVIVAKASLPRSEIVSITYHFPLWRKCLLSSKLVSNETQFFRRKLERASHRVYKKSGKVFLRP